jgi:hypothetical protein
MVAHTHNSSTGEAKARGLLSLRLVWATEQDPITNKTVKKKFKNMPKYMKF